jgi:hypothetical protein
MSPYKKASVTFSVPPPYGISKVHGGASANTEPPKEPHGPPAGSAGWHPVAGVPAPVKENSSHAPLICESIGPKEAKPEGEPLAPLPLLAIAEVPASNRAEATAALIIVFFISKLSSNYMVIASCGSNR